MAQHLAARLRGGRRAEPDSMCRKPVRSLPMAMFSLNPSAADNSSGVRRAVTHLPRHWRDRCSRAGGCADASSAAARFVNRSKETALLRQLAHNAGPSRQTALLVGDSGIGKSRLVHEFVDVAQARRVALIPCRMQPESPECSVQRVEGADNIDPRGSRGGRRLVR